MTVEEVKALVPKADVYCLDEQSRYLIVLRRQDVPLKAVVALGEAIKKATGNAPIILTVNDPMGSIRLLKVNE